MFDPVTITNLALDQQRELLRQAERDRLVRAARRAGDRRRRQRSSARILAIISRLFTTTVSDRRADEREPAPEDTATAA
jgi:hypothetical protein